LAEATFYIAYPKEYKKLMSHHNPDSLKKSFDSFWGKLFSNKNLAKSVFDSYYSRVEKANMFFTSYKEGWKTDPGMIYILYGPPTYVERDVEGMIWYYSSHSDDLSGEFYFKKIYNSGGYFPFTHYILVRNLYYERSFFSQVEDWRSGFLN
jgi:GWxTD domain-containing protein